MIDKLLTAETSWLAHMDGWDTDASGWVMMIGMVLFWALIVVAIVWLVRSAPWGGHHHRESPLEMLDRRFASGEITAEEYRERRSVLQGQPPGS
jgi:putative membrane protein